MHHPSSVLSSCPPNNLISVLYVHMSKHKSTSEAAQQSRTLRAAVMEVVLGVPKTMLTRMYDSMPKRLAKMLLKGRNKLNFGFPHIVLRLHTMIDK